MRFWDTSALLPLLVEEPATPTVSRFLEEDGEVVVWWSTSVECASALSRLRREDVFDIGGETQALGMLDTLLASCTEVVPTEEVRLRARRLSRVHALRAADALQLAAALVWSGSPAGHAIVTFDERLALAARLEGFVVLPGDAEAGYSMKRRVKS